jgi:hypothetical protein
VNIDNFAYAPVMAGAWQQYQVWDGTYTFDDLLDWHEMKTVSNINEGIAQDFMNQQKEADKQW